MQCYIHDCIYMHVYQVSVQLLWLCGHFQQCRLYDTSYSLSVQAYVFVVGGGNYIEYQNLQDYCHRQQTSRRITYGTSQLMNARQFLQQVEYMYIIIYIHVHTLSPLDTHTHTRTCMHACMHTHTHTHSWLSWVAGPFPHSVNHHMIHMRQSHDLHVQ